MTGKYVKINGDRWRLRFVKPSSLLGRWGECDWTNRIIKIVTGQDRRNERCFLIHEFLHARFPDLEEEAVTSTAEGLNLYLIKAGHDCDDD